MMETGEPVFLQAEEEITVHRSVQALRGDLTPIAEEQAQLRQDVQDLASEAANVLYNTAVRSEQSVAGLRRETGHALSQAESAIGQVGSSVQSLDAQVQQMSHEQQSVLERGSEGRAEDRILDERNCRNPEEYRRKCIVPWRNRMLQLPNRSCLLNVIKRSMQPIWRILNRHLGTSEGIVSP